MERRKATIAEAKPSCLILQEAGLALPRTPAQVIKVDCTSMGAKKNERPLAFLAMLTKYRSSINEELLYRGLEEKLKAEQLEEALELVKGFHASSL